MTLTINKENFKEAAKYFQDNISRQCKEQIRLEDEAIKKAIDAKEKETGEEYVLESIRHIEAPFNLDYLKEPSVNRMYPPPPTLSFTIITKKESVEREQEALLRACKEEIKAYWLYECEKQIKEAINNLDVSVDSWTCQAFDFLDLVFKKDGIYTTNYIYVDGDRIPERILPKCYEYMRRYSNENV